MFTQCSYEIWSNTFTSYYEFINTAGSAVYHCKDVLWLTSILCTSHVKTGVQQNKNWRNTGTVVY